MQKTSAPKLHDDRSLNCDQRSVKWTSPVGPHEPISQLDTRPLRSADLMRSHTTNFGTSMNCVGNRLWRPARHLKYPTHWIGEFWSGDFSSPAKFSPRTK